ncbi:hypothetical protein [Flexithrix dorotheae]|uniref:hypothetical protein n=1 Tax=Flexithrix dorotheae TaxID=70993 RepID=UPI0003790502|nr:hypothetical protein [Flexithrix dorotheae]
MKILLFLCALAGSFFLFNSCEPVYELPPQLAPVKPPNPQVKTLWMNDLYTSNSDNWEILEGPGYNTVFDSKRHQNAKEIVFHTVIRTNKIMNACEVALYNHTEGKFVKNSNIITDKNSITVQNRFSENLINSFPKNKEIKIGLAIRSENEGENVSVTGSFLEIRYN